MNEKNYLQKLLETVTRKKEDDLPVRINVVNHAKNGLIIKVCGLFGYLPFKNMPWNYRSINHWRAVSSSIVDTYFIGKIESIESETEPIKIITNATLHKFKTVELEHDFIYNGIIIDKIKFGLLIDIGNHFGWRYGSIVGFIHKSFFLDIEYFNQANVGQNITTYYQGKNLKEENLFGDIYKEENWKKDYIETLIGTTQIATVKINEKTNKKEYFLQDNIRCALSISKTLLNKQERRLLRAYMKTLVEGDEIACEILTCNHIKKKITVKIAAKNI